MMRVNSFFSGTFDHFSGDTLGKVCAQPPFLDVSLWYTGDFPACKSRRQCKNGKRGRMEKRKEKAGVKVESWRLTACCLPACFPFFRLTLTPSFVDRAGPSRSVVWATPARTTFAKGLPSSPAANNLTGGIGHFPARSRDRREQEGFPPSDEGVPQAVDSRGPWETDRRILAFEVTRRHEAGCFAAVTGEEEAGLVNSALRGAERELPNSGRPSPGTRSEAVSI
jgi:hypothetical protein